MPTLWPLSGTVSLLGEDGGRGQKYHLREPAALYGRPSSEASTGAQVPGGGGLQAGAWSRHKPPAPSCNPAPWATDAAALWARPLWRGGSGLSHLWDLAPLCAEEPRTWFAAPIRGHSGAQRPASAAPKALGSCLSHRARLQPSSTSGQSAQTPAGLKGPGSGEPDFKLKLGTESQVWVPPAALGGTVTPMASHWPVGHTPARLCLQQPRSVA